LIDGSISAAEIAALAERSINPEIARAMLEQSGIYDVRVAAGDLEISGDLSTFGAKLRGLVVGGSLRVRGRYSDFDDPASFTLVLGDFEADEVFTAGRLEVRGNATVRGALVGDENDYSATIGGDLRARLFYPEEHFFEVGGEARFGAAVGNSDRINREVVFTDGPALREILVDEVLYIESDDDELIVELDSNAARARFRAREPLIRANAPI
jgi:hypothetical protein